MKKWAQKGQRILTSVEVSSSLELKEVVLSRVTVTTIGLSPAPNKVDGISKSNVYNPGSINDGEALIEPPFIVISPILTDITAEDTFATPVR